MTPDFSPTLVDVGVFVIIAVFLLGGVRQILGIVNYFKAKPPLHDQYVSKAHFAEVRAGCSEAIHNRLDTLEVGLDTMEGEERKGRSGIHHDVRKVEERVAALESQNTAMNQQLVQNGIQLGSILSKLGSVEGELKRIRTV